MRRLIRALPLALLVAACADAATAPDIPEGPMTIEIRQSLTGPTTSAGTFRMTGALADEGTTTEEVTFGGPLDRPPVPVTFRRTLAGAQGTMVLTGSASLAFSSPTAATLTGRWSVESATGRYAALRGDGELAGTADFGAAPPTAAIAYRGVARR